MPPPIDKLQVFTNEALKAGIAFSAIGYTLTKTTSTILGAFSEWENAMASVRAKADASNEEFEVMKQLTLDLAGTTRYFAVEAADALKVLVEMGLEAADSVKALPIVMKFATTENMKLADAADVALGSMRGMGKGVSELEHITDLLASTAAKSASTIYSLGQGFKVAGPFAYASGQSMEDLAAVLGGLSNRMIRNEAAGYAVSQMLARLTRAATTSSSAVDETGSSLSRARSALKDLGLSVIDPLTKKMRPLPEIFKDLQKAGVSTAQMMDIFGIYTVKTATALLYAGRDVEMLRNNMEKLEGTTERMANIQLQSLANQWKMAQAEMNKFSITLGENLSEDALGWAQFLKSNTAAATGIVKNNKEITNSVLEFIASFGGLSLAVGAVSGLVWVFGLLNPYILASTLLVSGFYVGIQQVSKYLDTNFNVSLEESAGKVALFGLELAKTVGKAVWKYNPFTLLSEQIIKGSEKVGEALANLFMGPELPEVNLASWEKRGELAGKAFMEHLGKSIYRNKEPVGKFLEKYLSSNMYGIKSPEAGSMPNAESVFKTGPSDAEMAAAGRAKLDAYLHLYQGLRIMSEEHYQFELSKNLQTAESYKTTILAELELRKQATLALENDLIKRKFIEQTFLDEKLSIEEKISAVLKQRDEQTTNTKYKQNLQAELLPLEAQLKLYENLHYMTSGELELRKQILKVNTENTAKLLEEQGYKISPEEKQNLLDKGSAALFEDYSRQIIEEQSKLYSELEGLQTKYFRGREDVAKTLAEFEIEKINLWYTSLDKSLIDGGLAWEVYQAKVEEVHRKMILATGSFNEGFEEGLGQYIDSMPTIAEEGAQLATDTLKGAESTLNQVFTDFRHNDLKSWQSYLTSFADMVTQALQEMFIKMLLVKALGVGLGSLGEGSWAGLEGGAGAGAGRAVAHSGGFVTRHGITQRMHKGGLASDEVPAILQTGERVLSRKQNKMYENFVKNSRFGESSQNSQSANSQPVTVNNITIQAMDYKSFANFAAENNSVFANAIMIASKKNHNIRRF